MAKRGKFIEEYPKIYYGILTCASDNFRRYWKSDLELPGRLRKHVKCMNAICIKSMKEIIMISSQMLIEYITILGILVWYILLLISHSLYFCCVPFLAIGVAVYEYIKGGNTYVE